MTEDKMNKTGYMVFVMTLVCFLSAVFLGLVYNFTKPKILAEEKNARLRAIKYVLPEYENDPVEDAILIPVVDGEKAFYIGKSDGEIVGAAFVASAMGYSGKMDIMIGITPERRLSGIEILKHSETPGLGAKISSEKFKSQYENLAIPESGRFMVDEDGGEIDSITSATISSRAVCKTVNEGLKVFERYDNLIFPEEKKEMETQ